MKKFLDCIKSFLFDLKWEISKYVNIWIEDKETLNSEKYSKVKHKLVKLHKKYFFRNIDKDFYYIPDIFPIARGKVLEIRSLDLQWKTKYGTYRYEWSPSFDVILFNKWHFGYVLVPENYDCKSIYASDYWEVALTCMHVYDCDMQKCYDNWPWKDMDGNSAFPIKILSNETLEKLKL